MTKEEITKIFSDFRAEYNVEEDKRVWKEQSEEFRQFWREKILNDNYPDLSETDMDYVIRFFDCKAKGAKEFKDNGGRAAALAGIRQGLWYKAFRSLKNKKDIRDILNQIFITENDNLKIDLINQLEQINRENRNGLTGKQAIILNAFLFTYSPDKYLTMLSLSHRFALMDFFKLGDPKQYKNYGEQVIKTNNDIVSGFKEKYGVDITPLALSCFIYSQLEENYPWIEKIAYWKNSGVDQRGSKKYRKKYNNDQEESLKIGTGLITPETPFTNRTKIGRVIKSCEEYLYWFDLYFSRKGLELLSEFIDPNKVKNIKILMSIKNKNNLVKEVSRNFRDFETEMKNKGVICDLRVIIDPNLISKIHDRWIISKNQRFNIPSTDTIDRGKLSEIKETENRIPFEEWRDKGLDIITEWEKIEKKWGQLYF